MGTASWRRSLQTGTTPEWGWILDNGQEAGIKVDPGLLPQSNEDECRARAEFGLE